MANITDPSPHAPDVPAVEHVPHATTDTHPLPPPAVQAERSKMRRAASDGAQATIWLWFLAMLVILIAGAVAWGLRHRITPDTRQLTPNVPTLPGRTPAPALP